MFKDIYKIYGIYEINENNRLLAISNESEEAHRLKFSFDKCTEVQIFDMKQRQSFQKLIDDILIAKKEEQIIKIGYRFENYYGIDEDAENIRDIVLLVNDKIKNNKLKRDIKEFLRVD